MKTDIAIVVPVCGQHQLTNDLLSDLGRYAHNTFIVDNGGDYVPPATGPEILRPGMNLGWARGCNYGIRLARTYNPGHFLLINNDVRLSREFIVGLLDAALTSGAAVVGPIYDHNWPHQRGKYRGPAGEYKPREIERSVPFIDGTAMLIEASWLDDGIDSDTWPRFGWGCDKDFCLRVRGRDGKVVVTERSYLNHIGRATVRMDPWFSEAAAELENNEGMHKKYGPHWEDILYSGFPDLVRNGDSQDRLNPVSSARQNYIDLAP